MIWAWTTLPICFIWARDKGAFKLRCRGRGVFLSFSLFHMSFWCAYFCRMRTWIFLRMPTALCACLVQPTLCATCSHSLVMVAPRSGAFGRRRGNKSCGSLGILRHALQCGGIFGEILRRVLLKCLNANVYSSTVQPWICHMWQFWWWWLVFWNVHFFELWTFSCTLRAH